MDRTTADLRVLQIVRPTAGGIRRHVEYLYNGLPGLGIHVDIAAPKDTFRPGVIDATSLHLCAISPRSNLIRDLAAARKVARVSSHSNLLHGHGLRGAWIASLSAHIAHLPFIFTAHNLAPANCSILTRHLLSRIVKQTAAVVCVSQAVADSLSAYGTAGKVCVIPNGIDIAEFDSRIKSGLPSNVAEWMNTGEVIAAVGRLSKEKGFDILLGAMPYVLNKAPEVRFILAGDGPERLKLAGLAEKLGVASKLLMPGYVNETPALLDKSLLVVVPSRQEGQGLVVLEAMAAGKSVVAANVGGLPEVVANGATGLLIECCNSRSLAEAIADLIDDRQRRERFGNEGRKVVEQNFSGSVMLNRTAQLYRSIIIR